MPFDPKYFNRYRTVRQSPFQWPLRLTEEILNNPEKVDPSFVESARGYQTHIRRLTREGFTPIAAAEKMQREGYRLFGWNREIINRSVYPGIKVTKQTPMPAVPLRFESSFISRWNKEALLERLSTSVKKGPIEPVPLPEFYRGIAGRAHKFGIGRELLSRLGPEAPELLSETLFPTPWYQKAFESGKSILGKARGFPTKYKIGVGAAIGILGLYALQPGSWFSGKDDNFNSIEGLTHNGIAWQSRRRFTDFGSGYASGFFQAAKDFAKTESGKFMLASVGAGIVTGFATGDVSTGFQTAMGAIGGGSLGAFYGKKVAGAAIGGAALGTLGYIGSNTLGPAASLALGAVTTSVAASLMTAGSLRGGLLYKDTLKSIYEMGKNMGVEKGSYEQFIKTISGQFKNDLGIDILGPTGFAAKASDLLKNLGAGMGKEGAGPVIKKISGFLENHPTLTKYFDAAVGSPAMIDLATTAGGLEKATAGQISRAIGQDIVEGIPLGIAFGSVGLLGSLAFSGKDDAYNTIEGLSHKGMSGANRRKNTDFGSGYQGDDTSRYIAGSVSAVGAVGIGSYFWGKGPGYTNLPKNTRHYLNSLKTFRYKPGDIIINRHMLYDDPFHHAIIGDDKFVYEVQPGKQGKAAINRYGIEEYIERRHKELSADLSHPFSGVTRRTDLSSANRKTIGRAAREIYESKLKGAIDPIYTMKANRGLNEMNCISYIGQAYKKAGKQFYIPGTTKAYPWNVSMENTEWVLKGPIRASGAPRFGRFAAVAGLAGIGVGAATGDWTTGLYGAGVLGIGIAAPALAKSGLIKKAPLIGLALDRTRDLVRPALRSGAYLAASIPIIYSGIKAISSSISGKDDAYNTIEGLTHKGMAGARRRTNTDFGSGYQGDDTSSGVFTGLSVAGGAAVGGSLAYSSLRFEKYLSARHYPRLMEMRKFGKRGFRMWSPDWAALARGEFPIANDKIGVKALNLIFKTLNPVGEISDIEKFKGFLYIDSPASFLELLNKVPKEQLEKFGKQMFISSPKEFYIGAEKMKTYNYLKERGYTAQPLTVEASKYVENLDLIAKAWGGPENIIIKEKRGVRAEGVWMGLSKLEADPEAAGYFMMNSEDYLLQKRLNLADEFRVVTVGDKPVYSAYRWGPKGTREALDLLELISPKLGKKIKEGHLTENIIPVLNRDMKKKLEVFARETSSLLPYEVGAFDIGLTKEGQLKLIEAQRYFGTIKHPYVTEKIYQEITGKVGKIGKGIIGASILGGAFVGYALYNSFSGKDDDYNTIEGLPHGGEAERMRRLLTEFGSGYRGLLSLPEVLQPFLRKRGVSTTIERITESIGSKLVTAEQKTAFEGLVSEMRKSPFSEVAIINPAEVRKAAQASNISYTKALKGTIMHERLHQRMNEFGIFESLTSVKIPEKFTKRFAGRGMSEEAIAEEYLAYGLEERLFGVQSVEGIKARKIIESEVIPAMNLGNLTEEFSEIGMIRTYRNKPAKGGFFRRVKKGFGGRQKAHTKAQETFWKSAKNAGKGHLNMS